MSRPIAPALEKLADETDGRALDIIVAEDRDPTRCPRRRRHPLGIGERGRHRLFAPHVLARFERRDRHRRMERVRRRDRYDLDRRIGDQRPPVGGRGFEAELVGAPPRQPLLDLAQHDPSNDRPVAEHRAERRSRPARGTCPCSRCRSVRRRSCALPSASRYVRAGRPPRPANTNISSATQIGISVLLIAAGEERAGRGERERWAPTRRSNRRKASRRSSAA